MTKTFVKSLMAISIVAVFSVAQADSKCKVVGFNSGKLISGACDPIWSALDASGKFPDIFSADPHKLLPGFCFVSDGVISANLNNNAVNITTISAWTNEFLPAAFGLGADNLATVITRWRVRSAPDGKLLGDIYTRDTIDMASSSELDVVVAGSKRLANAKGAIRVDSFPTFDANGVHINITNIGGAICNRD